MVPVLFSLLHTAAAALVVTTATLPSVFARSPLSEFMNEYHQTYHSTEDNGFKQSISNHLLPGSKPLGFLTTNIYSSSSNCDPGENQIHHTEQVFNSYGLCVVEATSSFQQTLHSSNETVATFVGTTYDSLTCTGPVLYKTHTYYHINTCLPNSPQGTKVLSVQLGSFPNYTLNGLLYEGWLDPMCETFPQFSFLLNQNGCFGNASNTFYTVNCEGTKTGYFFDSECTVPLSDSPTATPTAFTADTNFPTLTPNTLSPSFAPTQTCFSDDDYYGISSYQRAACFTGAIPTISPTALPSSAPVASSSSSSCFSSDETVTLKSGTIKSMKEVNLGDEVLVVSIDGSFDFSAVVALPHGKDNQESAVFVELTTASGRDIKMTADHLLVGGSCDAAVDMALVAADSLLVNDCVQTVSGREAVVAKRAVSGRGVHTVVVADASKLLVVNGVVASPFAVNHVLTNAFYNIHRALFAMQLIPTVTAAAAQSVLNELGDLAVSLFG